MTEPTKHGVSVYPHVVERQAETLTQQGAQPLDVSRFTLSPWAKWIAADEDGEVWEYSKEPPCDKYGWGMPAHPFEMSRVGKVNPLGANWRQTLTPVNQVARTEPAPYLAARGCLAGILNGERSEVVQRRMRGYGDDDAVPVQESDVKPTTIDIAHSHTYPLIHCECGMAFVLLGCVADTVFEQGTPPFCPYCGKVLKDLVPADLSSIIGQLAQMTPASLETLAVQFVDVDATQCVVLIDALLAAMEVNQDTARHERIRIAIMNGVDEVETQLRMTQ